MAWVPPFNLDPHVAIRAPESLPVLMQRGIYDVIEKEDEGKTEDKFIRAFNYIAMSLTKSGRIRQGTLDLTPKGIERENEVKHQKDTKTKLYWLHRKAKKLYDEDPTKYSKTWWQANGRKEV